MNEGHCPSGSGSLGSRKKVLAVVFLVICLSCAAVHSQVTAQLSGGDNVGRKRALMIGINKYRAVPKLQGSLNDIETIRRVLVTRWGFQESDIYFLTDERATREGILAALKQFVNETRPLDMVYIHYSGHGSQVADLNGDEPDDKLDETIVPQDGRTGSIPDITDDELDVIFARLPTKNAFIVLDSCHSGTATRSLNIRTRSIPQDTRVDLYRQIAGTEVRTRGSVQLLPSHYVLMTGAAAHQEALDGPIEGRFHGFFSYALSKSLSSSSTGASAREIFSGVETELKRIQTHFGRASMPEPQLEAPPDLLDAPLLASFSHTASSPDSATRLAWLEVKGGDSGTVTLINGLLLGAAPGSTWAIYAADDAAFTPGRALAVATVTQLVGQDAKAKYYPVTKKISDHSRAIALMPAPIRERIPIHILEAPSAKGKYIEEVLTRNISNIELVGADQSPRFLVSWQNNEVQLLAADGLQLVGSFGGDGWGAGLALVVSRSVTTSELLTLDNPSSELKIDARVVNAPLPAKPKADMRGIALIAANTRPVRYRIRTPGQPRTVENSLQLQIRVNADAYITIVDVNSEGGINLLFPNDFVRPGFYPEGRIQAGQTALIPDSLQNGNQAGFHWDYSPPKGLDTVRVFGSTDLDTARMIRQKIKNLSSTAKTSGTGDMRAITTDIGSIRESLAGRTLRGIVAVYDPTPHIQGQVVAEQPLTPAISSPADTFRPLGTEGASPLPLEPGGPPHDWTATSITISVESESPK